MENSVMTIVNDDYTLNEKPVSKEEAQRIIDWFEGEKTVPLSEDNQYTVYIDYAENDEFIFPDSNKRFLQEAEMANMTLQELNYARNEIYARLGRDFNSTELKNYFGSKNWYRVIYTPEQFPYEILNQYEKYNVDLLYNREYTLSPDGYQLK